MNHLSTDFAPRPNLEYPFDRGWHPEPGQPFEVAEGVFWLHMPMPISLDHINLWLLKDDDGWTIVDSGLDTAACKAVWDQVFDGFLSEESVKRIVVTHFHPDHIGLAAWLAHRCDCKIWITEGEFRHYHAILNRDPEQHGKDVRKMVEEIGFEERFVKIYQAGFSVDDKPIESRVLEHMCHFIKDQDELVIGGRSWRVVMGNGHSPEHACLYCPELEVMISGDQALPRISSNISVYIINRHEDPLGDWLDSCARLRDQVPNDTLVLPSHQEPFYGLDMRMQQLIDDHHAQLNRLRLKMAERVNANQARSVLFRRELNDFETIMATGETMAHINYLLHRKEIDQAIAEDKSIQYKNV
ncbi:MAG: MBL fold metallo-hydrolase [Pseudomonadota bacterium]